ncbi:class I SAM-dependent methyltransferase [Streptomyces sp. NPDC094032]|uniref:class I SAM-dependent methyltransferase n=1 Tax=Streptomyces sp. NPDC094032 TaxID=3155308 RepID=UPI003323B30B
MEKAAQEPPPAERNRPRGCAEEARRSLVEPLYGTVLELGASSGANLPHYKGVARVVAVNRSGASGAARLRASAPTGIPVSVVTAAPGRLPFRDRSFDAVVSTMALCAAPDQATALAEIRRVLSPDGVLVFLEHVRSRNHWTAGMQDMMTPVVRRLRSGCRINVDTVTAIRAAGFRLSVLDILEPRAGVPRLVPFVRGRAYLP